MRLYERNPNDKINAVHRCFFEASHGRAYLALERFADLHEEFPNDAELVYAEGLLRKDYLGLGLRARELFEQAVRLDPAHGNAAFNAAKYARSEADFRHWAEVALQITPQDQDLVTLVRGVEGELTSGTRHVELLESASLLAHNQNQPAECAALAELALTAGGLPLDRELALRRARARSLRDLDREAHRYRETIAEHFPVEERLALRQAVEELENAIRLDEYDAELWNLKSGWCNLLGRYEDAIQCANKAIELRPHNYAKPWINKAGSLRWLDKDAEALACLQEALRQAEGSGDPADTTQASQMLDDFSEPRTPLRLEDVPPLVQNILQATRITADEEIGKWHGTPGGFVKGVVKRTGGFGQGWSMAYVRMLAELLSDLTPESAQSVLAEVARNSQEMYHNCLCAALYVAAYSEGVRQRDAARLLSLAIMENGDDVSIRRAYRESILEPSAAASDPLSRLDAILRAELARIHPRLPELIANQDPVDEIGRQRAKREVVSKFGPGPGPGSVAMGLALTCLLAWFGITLLAKSYPKLFESLRALFGH